MQKQDDAFAVSSMMKQVDAIIAQNLNDLSPEDRETSYSHVHGISDAIHETPSLISQSLELMQQEIDRIHGKDAYNVAESMSPAYVHSSVLRLKFLRGERFCARPAALKLVKHFEYKRYLFGSSKLVKDIEQDDLSDEDISVLYSGYVQWSPLKDSSQRTVSILFPLMSSTEVPVMSRMRVSFYLRMIAIEDLDFQRNGMVIIVSSAEFGSSFELDFNGWREGAIRSGEQTEALPGSLQGLHICFPRDRSFRSFLFSSLIKITISVLNPLLKVRVRIHRGETMEECMKRLQSFGITAAAIPKSPQENEYQTKLLQSRRNLERKRKESKVEDVESTDQQNPPCDDFGEWVCGPSKYDVILGRGQKCNLHPGNVRLRKLVDEAKHLYEQSEKREKGVMIARMVQAIQQQGRFLHESDIGWAEVTDKVARQKVSHTFRDAGKRKKPPTSTARQSRTYIT